MKPTTIRYSTPSDGGQFSFPFTDWSCKSRESRDFVRRLLQKDPRRRMTAREAMVHPWILKHAAVDRKEVQIMSDEKPLDVQSKEGRAP
ncbi:hypothetical protein ACHAW5_007616 [Stephanodiscus triporus]|uniref:Aurora kinase n=1 Tax=Stephanodiscus triporus TaxID=2934178 RepID=A0ABD3MKF5_9STRA